MLFSAGKGQVPPLCVQGGIDVMYKHYLLFYLLIWNSYDIHIKALRLLTAHKSELIYKVECVYE